MHMQDSDIRKVLHTYLKKENKSLKDTKIVDELDLCSGLSRIDIAVINGVIHGYEIKSEEDTLNRLPIQMSYYNKSLEKVTIATNKSHLIAVKESIPKWWGVILVNDNKKRKLTEIRKAKTNPQVDGRSLLQLLWRDELLLVVEKHKLGIKRNSNRRILQELIANELEVFTISQEVRDALKARKNWRS